MTDQEYDEELRLRGYAAVVAAFSLLPSLEKSAVRVKLGEDRVCVGLQLPEWVYELPSPCRWSAIMTDSTGRKWDIAAVWVLSEEEQALITKLPAADGTGRTSDYARCFRPCK